jgi:hypothetical protein
MLPIVQIITESRNPDASNPHTRKPRAALASADSGSFASRWNSARCPRQMDRKSGAFGSCRFGCGKERETFPGVTLHFHQMDDNVNGARMSGQKAGRLANV